MFAFLVGDAIGLKLSPDHLAEAMLIAGACAMRPDADSEPMREYVQFPREILDDYEVFVMWVERSAEYVRQRTSQSA